MDAGKNRKTNGTKEGLSGSGADRQIELTANSVHDGFGTNPFHAGRMDVAGTPVTGSALDRSDDFFSPAEHLDFVGLGRTEDGNDPGSHRKPHVHTQGISRHDHPASFGQGGKHPERVLCAHILDIGTLQRPVEFRDAPGFPISPQKNDGDFFPVEFPDQIQVAKKCPVLVDKDTASPRIDTHNRPTGFETLLDQNATSLFPVLFGKPWKWVCP